MCWFKCKQAHFKYPYKPQKLFSVQLNICIFLSSIPKKIMILVKSRDFLRIAKVSKNACYSLFDIIWISKNLLC